MDTQEIWDIITSKPKWYAGILTTRGSFHTAHSANRLKHRFKDGTLSPRLIEHLFAQFGYIQVPGRWIRKSS